MLSNSNKFWQVWKYIPFQQLKFGIDVFAIFKVTEIGSHKGLVPTFSQNQTQRFSDCQMLSVNDFFYSKYDCFSTPSSCGIAIFLNLFYLRWFYFNFSAMGQKLCRRSWETSEQCVSFIRCFKYRQILIWKSHFLSPTIGMGIYLWHCLSVCLDLNIRICVRRICVKFWNWIKMFIWKLNVA